MEIKRFYKTDNSEFTSIFMMRTLEDTPFYKVYAVSRENPTQTFYDGRDEDEANKVFEELTRWQPMEVS